MRELVERSRHDLLELAIAELSPRWARNIVTLLARIEGCPVGILANQPRHLGGVIDAAVAEKAALFVVTCDRFGLPLVVPSGNVQDTRRDARNQPNRGAAEGEPRRSQATCRGTTPGIRSCRR